MRWGEPNKVPPLTRSRGMFAASSLVVAVLATYASVAVLSLSAAAPFSIVGQLPGVHALVKGIGWSSPTVSGAVREARPASADDRCVRALWPTSASSTSANARQHDAAATVKHHEHDAKPLPLQLAVTGHTAPSVSAMFAESGTANEVPVGQSATHHADDQPGVRRPDRREPSRSPVPARGSRPRSFRSQGAQAPLAPWPCHRHSGVPRGRSTCRGRRRARSAASPGTSSSALPQGRARSSRSVALTSGTTVVDQTSADGTVLVPGRGVRTGSARASEPGRVRLGSATSDSTPPAAPQSVNPPQFIDSGNRRLVLGAGRPSLRARRRATRSR